MLVKVTDRLCRLEEFERLLLLVVVAAVVETVVVEAALVVVAVEDCGNDIERLNLGRSKSITLRRC